MYILELSDLTVEMCRNSIVLRPHHYSYICSVGPVMSTTNWFTKKSKNTIRTNQILAQYYPLLLIIYCSKLMRVESRIIIEVASINGSIWRTFINLKNKIKEVFIFYHIVYGTRIKLYYTIYCKSVTTVFSSCWDACFAVCTNVSHAVLILQSVANFHFVWKELAV